MTREEFDEALALVEDIFSQDHKIGRALSLILHHVAHVAGVDTSPKTETPEESASEEAPAEASEKAPAQTEEAAPEGGNA